MSEPPVDGRTLRLGTRGSKLALWQSNWVADKLRAEGHEVELVEIRTSGDGQEHRSLAEVSQSTGTQGLFTKEIQRALLEERVDLAVHSLKDLPTTPVEGLAVAAVPEREGVRDAFLSARASSIDELAEGARVGTGSARRKAQLLSLRPDLEVLDLRGNVDTRLRKLDEGLYDAILLAESGLNRLGLGGRITQAIPADVILPAPGQGALAIECRAGDAATRRAASALNHPPTRAATNAERAALAYVEGGCLAAVGAWGRADGDELKLTVVVLSEDGKSRLFAEATGAWQDAIRLGESVANDLLEQGAQDLLRAR